MDRTGVASTDIPADCVKYVRTYATGLRNSYDFVFHSTGNLWATDNALGVTGSFPVLPSGYKQGNLVRSFPSPEKEISVTLDWLATLNCPLSTLATDLIC